MNVLGIESTAHTFGVGIIQIKRNKPKIVANERKLFQTEEGGMIPADVSRHHVEYSSEIIQSALKKANLKIKDIDLISFSQSPGIGHTLKIGAATARMLSAIHNIPLIGVNHCIAHLEIGNITTKSKDPVLLYASGANTQVIAYSGGKYRIFGETLDMGVGNFIDSFAREAGLGFPGGPKIEEKAKYSTKLIELPYSVKGMDVSFGGILTNLKNKLKTESIENLSYSLQETVFAMLVEVAERAMAHTKKKELLLGGGVACNQRLQEMCKIMCEERGAKLFCPEKSLLVDNGAMIAWLGYLMYKAGNKTKLDEAYTDPYTRTDEIKVNWR